MVATGETTTRGQPSGHGDGGGSQRPSSAFSMSLQKFRRCVDLLTARGKCGAGKPDKHATGVRTLN